MLEVYKVTNPFPRSEQFEIVSQLRRAAYSILSNPAEGYGRRSKRELLQFLAIANGSAKELRYFLILSTDLKFMSPSDLTTMNKEITSIVQMISALGRSLKNRSAAGSVAFERDTGHGSRVTTPPAGVNR